MFFEAGKVQSFFAPLVNFVRRTRRALHISIGIFMPPTQTATE